MVAQDGTGRFGHETASKVTFSLEMDVEFIDGSWIIAAPWLDSPVQAPTFEIAYWLALKKRSNGSP